MANTIDRLTPIIRNTTQVPNLVPLAEWCDSILLVAGVAQSYAVKTDGGTPPSRGIMLRLNSNAGPIYVNPLAVAVIPTATTVNGSSSILLNCHLASTWLAMPSFGETLSFICNTNAILTIEAWQ